jgi:2-keto-4-pentenoate hydratase
VASDAELIAEFIRARTDHRAHTPPSERQGTPLTLAEAYRLQDLLRETLIGRGETLTGWKAGFTNDGAQKAYGVSEPVCAFLLASGTLPAGAEVPASRFAGLAVEAEVAFVMRRDLAGPGVTPATAAAAVEGAQPALELVDFRYTGKPVGTDVIAEGVFAKHVVLAGALTPLSGLDLEREALTWEQGGRVMATTTTAEVMGNPLNSLAWIANHLGARGLSLKAGDLVMSGSVSAMLRPKAGETVRAAFARLGAVSVRFV